MKSFAMGKAIVRLLVIVLISLIVSACSERLAVVKPYEREHFASDKMLFSPMESASEHEAHVLLIREASEGGESSFQGGCGCR
ncbi:MAG: DUF4266 domain-containing protein [Nitrospirae bacterium]|nr:DUF4266 domain-containing protein [Nitrospirota bacterium]